MFDSRIVRVEWGVLPGRRPRAGGGNARLLTHGLETESLLMRLQTDDGHVGFGWSNCARDRAGAILGQSLQDVFRAGQGPGSAWWDFEYPLWDLVGCMSGQPVHQILRDWHGTGTDAPVSVPCYDTTLLIDDLEVTDDGEAVALLRSEARFGFERGHRNFKIKVGRGARHFPLEQGTARDIAIIQGVRDEVGPDCRLMIDANNGYNLNLAKRVLSETADAGVFWLEEAFHEDPVLYEDLQHWKAREGLSVYIADGEGGASPHLMDWARAGLVDVVQYDIFAHGFTQWLTTGRTLDAWGVISSPHHYGRVLGNYVSGHLAPAVKHFGFIEWDHSDTPGLHAPYAVRQGEVELPSAPGFGLTLDDALFRQAVADGGYRLTLD